ncbi:MAG: type II toxin-antitoxin system HipA family toxin [Akkermansia sp.]
MKNATLQVWLYQEMVGTLSQDLGGRFEFEYVDGVSHALSLSLPLSQKFYDHKSCEGFFNGLLPEGDAIRDLIAKKHGISAHNDFSLLRAIGYDCAGAVSFMDESSPSPTLDYHPLDGRILSDDELEDIITHLPQKPLSVGDDGIRLSLAGAQHKTALLLLGDKLASPLRDVPTSHIIKPAIDAYEETIENEYICLETARAIGLDVPKIEIRHANKTKFFMIERYDRHRVGDKIARLHQEDFCQATNKPSVRKYQKEGGVSYKDCADILRQTRTPARFIRDLLDRIIFNFLIGNNDAHGKNFSLVHGKDGKCLLAPCYDMLCTQVYPELTRRMAMKIGHHDQRAKLELRHFQAMAQDMGVSEKALVMRWAELSQQVPLALEQVIQSIPNTIGKRILDEVNKNCAFVSRRF